MFVDASAILAIMDDEPDAERLGGILTRAGGGFTTAIAVFEATLGIRRKLGIDDAAAEVAVKDFLIATNIRIVPISADAGFAALAAHARYGKGRGHKAKLNMGDCFACAVAKAHRAKLLFTGNDFPHTDITPAS